MNISFRKTKEFIIEKCFFFCGIITIIFVILIFVFLFKESLLFLLKVNIKDFFCGNAWYPTSIPPKFGIFPLIVGSLLVTLGACLISIPIGIMVAFYVAEIAPVSLKEIFKVGIELLAAIPSVILGFIGLTIFVPLIKKVFSIPTGLTAFTGSIMLAFMAIPTIVTIAEDSIRAVPSQYKLAALALGATKWQMLYKVILPAALPGITAAVMLGIGRVIGETMVVLMITGNAAIIPHSLFQPVRTMTATIAAEMGETIQGSLHYGVLFAIGLVLFIITFIINFIGDLFLHKRKIR